jgi:hypothetical protein
MTTPKLSNLAKQPAASKQTYDNLKNGPAKPTTANETQQLAESPRYCTIYKGALTKSHLYERLHPDGQTAALRIDGPADSFICQNNLGAIIFVSGKYNKESGPGSGKLNFHSHGGTQQKHENRSNYEYSAGDDPEKQALNIICYGDVIEDAKGSQRTIKATKIILEASGELYIKGHSVIIDANGGTGSIQMFAGNVEQTTANKKDIVVGQVMKYGVSEETTVQFDPRASVNWLTPGHVNWKILGDYQQWVGGIEEHIVAGGVPVPPLIKTRDSVYTVKTAAGLMTFDAATGISQKAGAGVDVKAGGAFNVDAGGVASIKSGGSFSANAGGDASMRAAGTANMIAGGTANMTAGATANITSAGNINVIGVGNVKIRGALIFLN